MTHYDFGNRKIRTILMDEVSMPLGRKLTGLKFLDGNLEVICSAGMLNLLPKRQLDIQ